MLQVKPPTVDASAPLAMLVANIDYDEHKGRIAIGRVLSGTISRCVRVQGSTAVLAGVECVLSALAFPPSPLAQSPKNSLVFVILVSFFQ